MSDRDNRVEHGTLAAGKSPGTMHRLRISGGVSPAYELQAVGLIGYLLNVAGRDAHQVEHPWRRLVKRARPASAKDRPLPADNLGLNKEIAERRMQRVGCRRCENDFRIARQVDHSAGPGTVSDRNPAQFDVILR